MVLTPRKELIVSDRWRKLCRLKKGEGATEAEIIAFCKESIADIKVPRCVFFVDEFPLNPQGKVQKFKQREWAVEKLKLRELE